MLSGKFLFTLIGLVVAIFAICKLDFGQHTVEGFFNNIQFGVKAMPYAEVNGRHVAAGGNYLDPNMLGSGKFVQVPHFQGILAPRFSNLNYGAHIRYNMPDYKNQGVPYDPLTFGEMAKENYHGQGGPVSCGKGGLSQWNSTVAGGHEVPTSYTHGNYSNMHADLRNKSSTQFVNNLPIGTMTTMDVTGNTQQPVMYNRLMYANVKSRLRAHGDPIRGDLAIVPCQHGWHSVYPNLNIDLQEGALNVMGGGADNSSYNKLMELMVRSSGGSKHTFGGVNLHDHLSSQNVNMSNQSVSNLSSALGDLGLTSYP